VTVGGSTDASYRDTLRLHRHRAFDASFAPVHWVSASLFSSTRSFGYAAVHGHLRKLQANESIVSFKYRFAQRIDHPQFDPLVASVAKRGGRTGLVGDPVVGATEHQDLDELLEDHTVGYARTVAP
jgi:hypothetical protein